MEGQGKQEEEGGGGGDIILNDGGWKEGKGDGNPLPLFPRTTTIHFDDGRSGRRGEGSGGGGRVGLDRASSEEEEEKSWVDGWSGSGGGG